LATASAHRQQQKGRSDPQCNGRSFRRRDGAGQDPESVARARPIGARKVGFAFAFDVDVELVPEGVDAFLEVVTMVDVLTVAKQCTFGPAALGFAPADDIRFACGESLRLAIDLALETRSSAAGALTRSLALAFATRSRRHDFTL